MKSPHVSRSPHRQDKVCETVTVPGAGVYEIKSALDRNVGHWSDLASIMVV